MLNVSGSPSASEALGVNVQASPTITTVVGAPEIVGAEFDAGGGGPSGAAPLWGESRQPPSVIETIQIAMEI